MSFSETWPKKLAGLILTSSFLLIFLYLLKVNGIDQLRERVEVMGPLAPFGIFLLRSSSIIFPVFPSTAYSLLAGALLGFKKGLLVICLTDLISCSVSFWISRIYGRKLVGRLVGKNFMGKIEGLSKKHLENNFLLMVGFLMTGLFDFISYGIGLTKASWRKFFPALVLSIMISNPPIVALGAGVLDGGKKILIFSALGIIFLSILSSKLRRFQTLV